MRSGLSIPLADDDRGLRSFARRQASRAAGMALLAGVAFALAALGTWNVDDPSFSHATDNLVTNAMGYPGAVVSDLAMQFFGLSSVAALVPAVIWGFLLASGRGVDRMGKRAAAWFGAALLFAAIAGCLTPPLTWPLPTGLGGVFGDMVLKLPALLIGSYPKGFLRHAGVDRAGACRAGAVRLWLRPHHAQQGPRRRPRQARGTGRRRSLRRRGRRRRRARARRDRSLVAVVQIVPAPLDRPLPRQPAGALRSRRRLRARSQHSDERDRAAAGKAAAGNSPARREPGFAAELEPAFEDDGYDLDISSEMLGGERRHSRPRCRISARPPAPASPVPRRARSPARACSARRRPR